MRTSSGVARVRIERISELMQLDFPAPVAPATSRWGIFVRLATTMPPSTSLPRATSIGWCSRWAMGARRTSPSMTISGSVFGISTPTALLPGMGLMMRTSGLLTAYAMLRPNWMMRSTFTPGPREIS